MLTSFHAPQARGGTATPLQAIADDLHTCAQPVQAAAEAHPQLTITFQVKRESLPHFNDEYLAQLWHIAQANPAPYGDRDACELVEAVGREIVKRWLVAVPPALWHHQGRHVQRAAALASEGRAST